MKPLPYPPPYQDTPTLAAHLSVHENTIGNWVKQGILPAPKARGGKVLWKWSEVVKYLDNETPPPETHDRAQAIKDATRQAASETRKDF